MNASEAELEELLRSQEFDEDWYLNEYPDVKGTGMDAARHYLWIGRLLGRLPSAKRPRWKVPPGMDPHVYKTVSAGFNLDFYLSNYPDVEQAGVNPIAHYINHGWIEGRDPSGEFSTRHYLETYPDVRDAGVNPFYHYLAQGKAEGRTPRHELGFRYDILANLKPVAEQIAISKANRRNVTFGSADELRAALSNALEGGRRLVLSFSHDDFVKHVGGVQLLLRRELGLLRERGLVQVNFHPVHPLHFLDTSGEDVPLGVTIDGKSLGAFHRGDVVDALGGVPAAKVDPSFVVHNLLGHNVDQVISIIEATGAKSGHFWIHDYAALYNNYKLMRNDVEFTGVPHPGTVAWDLCEFARADFSHRAEVARLFEKFAIDLISPSRAALAIWDKAGVLRPNSRRVIEHCTLHERGSTLPGASNPVIGKGEKPLKVGYLGYPVDHKGWPIFRDLVRAFADDPRYEFYHLGIGGSRGLPVISREVVVDEANPDRMRDVVEAEALDVALVWSLWPETYCLIAYEALAGGAAIVTNQIPGNVRDLVQRSGEGLVLNDEKDLHALFDTGDIRHLSRARRTVRHFDIEYSELTAACLEQ